ncbi:DUF262 domain-containing protein [Phaeodactylibacter xiamenensis]|uniref:DUF262 domain-containing protein n=1 Tax=Phaeodactylibacter xiamenensis TaxID=1524460 RepID=UPI0024A89DAF|nr:DUF262 domain-containing protein [Phaeodactylibacter xiamenensis]
MNQDMVKQYSFYELMSKEGMKIKIPIIQRDYAQGRENVKELRENFLNAIKKHLDKQKPLNLDFIFGTQKENHFIPIDGQQRLTTLFLLHWYLGWSADQKEHISKYLGENFSKFTYETRTSSKDFCKALVTKPLKKELDDRISKIIKDQEWFFLNWRHDPTISGMLNTLDSIEKIFDKPKAHYDALVSNDGALVSFQFIEIKDFGLSDQLYIKMNARGKPLTNFENFKANAESIFQAYDEANRKDCADWLTKNIDGKWTDLMWSALSDKSELVDHYFMNFLQTCLVNKYAITENSKIDSLRSLIGSRNTKFDFYLLEALKLNEFTPLEYSFRTLDVLCSESSQFKSLVSEDIIDDKQLIHSVLEYNLSYPKRIQFFALSNFLLDGKAPLHINEWMRFIRNLTENSRIETVEEFESALKSVDKLLIEAERILKHVADFSSGNFIGFSVEQSKEEVLKAKLLISDKDTWEKRIKSLENHPYLQGSIGFILEFSGIDKPESTNDKALERFDNYVLLFNALFKDDGIAMVDRHFLFERALLCQGDYLLTKGRNHSFLVNGNERDISWKRYLRSSRKKYLKQLMDTITPTTYLTDFQKQVNEFEVDDWRYFFIKYPEIIGQTGPNKLIRRNEYNENEILLLEKTQLNGAHREYYSYSILCELQEEGVEVEYQPGTNREYSSKYISSIDGEDIKVSYYPDGEYEGYWIESDKIEGGELVFDSHEEVLDYLRDLLS